MNQKYLLLVSFFLSLNVFAGPSVEEKAMYRLEALSGKKGKLTLYKDNGVIIYQGLCQLSFNREQKVTEIIGSQLVKTHDRPIPENTAKILEESAKWGRLEKDFWNGATLERFSSKRNQLLRLSQEFLSNPKNNDERFHKRSERLIFERNDKKAQQVAIGKIETSFFFDSVGEEVGTVLEWESLAICQF